MITTLSGAIQAGLRCRCPRCGKGKLFAGFLDLQPRCKVCQLDYGFADSGEPGSVAGRTFLCRRILLKQCEQPLE